MRNNIQNDVKVENDKLPTSKFNLSGSYYTTSSVGEVGVACCRPLQAGTRALMGTEKFVLTAPLVAPCYAKMHYKTWSYFVPLEDVWPNYSAYRTQQKISRNGVVFRPTKKPSVSKDILSLYALNGAKCTIFARLLPEGFVPSNAIDYVSGEYFDFPEEIFDPQSVFSDAALYRAIMTQALNLLYTNPLDSYGAPDYDSLMKIHVLLKYTNWTNVESRMLSLRSGNYGVKSFCRRKGSVPPNLTRGFDVSSYVPLGRGDITFYKVVSVTYEGETRAYMIAYNFRLSSWGRHYKKLLEGLGYRLDCDSLNEPREILRILAAYHSYWYSFGIDYWQNFETTSCKRLETMLSNTDDVEIDDNLDLMPMFDSFILDEFGSMWITEQNDYVSAHTPQPTISRNDEFALLGIVDVAAPSGNYTESSPRLVITPGDETDTPVSGEPSMAIRDGHAYTRVTTHGALDSELLKRMYKSINRNTILGKKIGDLMRVNGLGAYMERTRTNFIGETSLELNVSSVISNSDTFKPATDSTPQEGAVLGQRAGKCVGYQDNSKKLYYKTDSFGYWITLDAITCDSGYAQSEDMTCAAVELDQDYSPRYDGVGFQLDSKAIVNGARDEVFGDLVSGDARSELSMSNNPHGFAPRYNEWKIGRNCVTGGFANKSTRDYYTSYNMEKLLYPDSFIDHILDNSVSGAPNSAIVYQHVRTFSSKDVPIAGPVWLYLARWPWLSNLLRIFAVTGAEAPASIFRGLSQTNLELLAKKWEMIYYQDDNYIIMSEHWFKAWAPMLPIEETYGTIDPERKMLEYVDHV